MSRVTSSPFSPSRIFPVHVAPLCTSLTGAGPRRRPAAKCHGEHARTDICVALSSTCPAAARHKGQHQARERQHGDTVLTSASLQLAPLPVEVVVEQSLVVVHQLLLRVDGQVQKRPPAAGSLRAPIATPSTTGAATAIATAWPAGQAPPARGGRRGRAGCSARCSSGMTSREQRALVVGVRRRKGGNLNPCPIVNTHVFRRIPRIACAGLSLSHATGAGQHTTMHFITILQGWAAARNVTFS